MKPGWGSSLTHLLLAVAACYSLQDLRNEGCRVLCIRDGHTGGKEFHKKCVCETDEGDYEDFAAGRVQMGSEIQHLETPKPRPYRFYTPEGEDN